MNWYICFGCLSFNTLHAVDEMHLELSQHSGCSKPIYCSEVLRSAIRIRFRENPPEWADALLETKTLGWKPPSSAVEDFEITAQVEIYKSFITKKNINFDEQKREQIIHACELQKLKHFISFREGAGLLNGQTPLEHLLCLFCLFAKYFGEPISHRILGGKRKEGLS